MRTLPVFFFALVLTICPGLSLSFGDSTVAAPYRVRVDGRPVPVAVLRTAFDLPNMPDWFTSSPQTAMQQEVAVAEVFLDAKADIGVEIESEGRLGAATISPLSRGIRPEIRGQRMTFGLPGPDKLYIDIPDGPALCLFVSPTPAPPPEPDAPGVRFFGAGEHRAGTIELRNDETLVLAPGAVVHGRLRANRARNIRVMGGGTLDGEDAGERLVILTDCAGVRLEDVTFRNSESWTVTLDRCTGVSVRDVKVIGFGPSSDGINPLNCTDVSITRSFFRSTDDCIAIKAPDRAVSSRDIRVSACTMVGYAYSDGVTIGFETNAPSVSDIHVWDCDVVMARGGSRVDGHSGFSIICDGPADIHDVLFEDIRVEQVEHKLFELNVTEGRRYGEGPPGRIRNVILRKIAWLHKAPIVLQAHSETNRISGVLFEDCTVAGLPLEEVRDEVLRVGPFVDDVVIRSDQSAAVE